MRLRVGDMARLGDILRKALESGANRIDGITFGQRDPEAARASSSSSPWPSWIRTGACW